VFRKVNLDDVDVDLFQFTDCDRSVFLGIINVTQIMVLKLSFRVGDISQVCNLRPDLFQNHCMS